MRYQIRCKSLLLQKALEEFLKDYIFEDGKIISDTKGDIVIGRDIKKPFSKSSLLIQLEKVENRFSIKNFNKLANETKYPKNDIKQVKTTTKNITFEQKLDKLIDNFTKQLKKLIKEEYGKK